MTVEPIWGRVSFMGKIIGIISLLLVFVVIAIVVIKTEPKKSSEGGNVTVPTTPPIQAQVKDVEKLLIEDIKVGSGSAVKKEDIVTVNYIGTLLDGTKFDSSYDRNTPFVTKIGVGAVIQGWDEGMIGMKVGGKRKLTIPSKLGYGDTGAGRLIPPNAGLIFEVELLEIKPQL